MHSDFYPTGARGIARRLRELTAYMLIAFATATLLGCSGRGDAPASEANLPAPALTVTNTRPQEVTGPVTMKASGAIAAWEEAIIGNRVGGYQLVEVLVNVGDSVRKGQVLARLDRSLLLAEQAQLQASSEEANANRQRALTLGKSGGMSERDVLQLVTQAKAADAALAAKDLQLKYTDVLAPDDGVISARTATLGAVVPVGQELVRMIRQGRLEWRGELSAAQLSRVSTGQRVTLMLPDGASAVAHVRQLSPALDAQTRLGLVYADVEPKSRARAGMYVDGHIVLSDARALVIPAASVVIRDGRSHVLKLAGDAATPRVALQRVTIGRREAREVEILEGLDVNDRVVVQGAGFLSDGDVVRLADAAPQASSAESSQ